MLENYFLPDKALVYYECANDCYSYITILDVAAADISNNI